MAIRKQFFLSFVVVFISGLIFGGILTNGFIKHQIAREMTQGPEVARAHLIEMIAHELELNKSQREALEPLIKSADQKLMVIKSRSLPEVEQIFEDHINQSKTILTASQQAKVLTLYTQMRTRWQQIQQGLNQEKLL